MQSEIFDFEEMKSKIQEIELDEANRHSYVEDVQLFSTIQGKYDFLQRYVVKYKQEFILDSCSFNELSEKYANELEEKEEKEEKKKGINEEDLKQPSFPYPKSHSTVYVPIPVIPDSNF